MDIGYFLVGALIIATIRAVWSGTWPILFVAIVVFLIGKGIMEAKW